MAKNRLIYIMNTYDLIKKSLDATNLRSQTIAHNMANINTKNFKRSYVSFEETLKNSSEFKLKKTNEKHLGQSSYGEISVKTDNATSMRTDGNNVDLDVEKVNQAATSLQYNALITLTNEKLNDAKLVIGGR